MEMLTWEEMQQTYKDEWLAMTDWEEDEHGDVLRGHVAFHAAKRKVFYDYINQAFANRDLAIRYTGNVQGPFFLDR